MRSKFYGFYKPSKSEVESIWEDSIVSFDTNSLLNLYRYSKTTRDDFIKELITYSDRLWIPYQVSNEFFENRLKVISDQENSHKIILDEISKSFSVSEQILNRHKNHPSIDVKKIKKKIEKLIGTITVYIDSCSKTHPQYEDNDEVLETISDLFNDNIGDEMNEDILDKIFEEGEKRYEKNIPPGYSDLKEKRTLSKRKLYGDLIIWKELIKISSEKKKNLIFVTDDQKDDWWMKHKGKTVQPRGELITEFYNQTGFRILIYSSDVFLKISQKRNKSSNKVSVDEIQSFRSYDKNLNLLSLDNVSTFNNYNPNQLIYDPNIYLKKYFPFQIDKNGQMIIDTSSDSIFPSQGFLNPPPNINISDDFSINTGSLNSKLSSKSDDEN